MHIKRNIKKTVAAFVCVVLAAAILGCGQLQEIDASRYVQIWLDCVFLNDTTASVKNQAERYEEQMQDITANFLANYSEDYEITQELENDFREIFKELFAKARYTVGDARRREDGSYVVNVTCEQVQFYDAYEAEYKKAVVDLYKQWKQVPASAPSSEEDANKYVMGLLRDSMKTGLSHIEYAAPVEITVTVEPDGKSYKISDADVYLIEKELFDIFDMSKAVSNY